MHLTEETKAVNMLEDELENWEEAMLYYENKV